MSRCLTILLLALLTSASITHGDERRDLVLAARHAALDELVYSVMTMPLNGRVTIGDVAEQSRADIDALLAGAEQIGGPRWLEAQAAQVRMEIAGNLVRDWLIASVRESRRSPIPQAQLTGLMADWESRRFAAEGTAASPAVVSRAMADRLGPIAARKPDEREKLIREAVHDAAQRAIARVNDVPLPVRRTVGAMLAIDPANGPKLLAWLTARPIIAVRVADSDKLVVTIHIAPDSLARTLQEISGDREGDWSGVPNALVEHVLVIDGVAALTSPTTAAAPLTARGVDEIELPKYPPEWATRLVRAEGSALNAGDRLRTARAAEQSAIANLRTAIGELPVGENQPVAKFIERNPASEHTLRRAISRANVSRINYHADGGATVEIVVDGRFVWQALLDAAN
jgi:hypothetical protein